MTQINTSILLPNNKKLLKQFPIGSDFLYISDYGGKLSLNVYCVDKGMIFTRKFNNKNDYTHYNYSRCISSEKERKLKRILNIPNKTIPFKYMIEINNLRSQKLKLLVELNVEKHEKLSLIKEKIKNINIQLKIYEIRIEKGIK